jgi:hypothetical protein
MTSSGALLEQELIFGPKPNAHPTAHGPAPVGLEPSVTCPADALNREGDETFQQRGFGQLLTIREGTEMRLRIRSNANTDELRGSHGCQVFNNSRREAILHFAEYVPNTSLLLIPARPTSSVT